ncbi:MFS transporter [Hyphomonas johnsonii]|uniref:Major facilitator family transporter n=1 Tax=Hyphomonas johnsonii MHS-2 TaxID=1280950 RepID=A0A059FNG3_9PROT|nr:MFS transporter [Hyphomonas johnsonii]KCZ92184.1 major facilitator family transporter [Hyphomonas johnsonii MHS-2]
MDIGPPRKDMPPPDAPAPAYMSDRDLYILAAATAVVTANAYYIHPIISLVAKHFGVSESMIGLVPALNQIALALGILLLLPLGDWVSNRKLVSIFVAAQFLSIALMTFAQDYWLFVTGSTLLGFFTIAPYLLPAYVSKRVAPGDLGRATAIIATGIIAGILVARAGAGVIAEHFGWRAVYFAATGLMLAVSFALPLILEKRREGADAPAGRSYVGLIASIVPIVRNYPEILLSGAIQALSFGIFLSIWLGLGLHLTSPEMGYGVDVVGYLAIFSIINLVTTPRLGAWADKVGPKRARLTVASTQLLGVTLLFFFGNSLWLLMIPIVIMNIGGPLIDITTRMTFLSKASDIRTRLMTVYIVIMFLGAGAASWAGTTAYDLAGWHGNAVLALGMGICLWTLCLVSLRVKDGGRVA